MNIVEDKKYLDKYNNIVYTVIQITGSWVRLYCKEYPNTNVSCSLEYFYDNFIEINNNTYLKNILKARL
jgi:hypothetical protein